MWSVERLLPFKVAQFYDSNLLNLGFMTFETVECNGAACTDNVLLFGLETNSLKKVFFCTH
jgi:hypothetical protein